MQTILLVRFLSVAALLVMALCEWTWKLPYIILPLYTVRFALANCTYAVSKSILNDYVPKVRA